MDGEEATNVAGPAGRLLHWSGWEVRMTSGASGGAEVMSVLQVCD